MKVEFYLWIICKGLFFRIGSLVPYLVGPMKCTPAVELATDRVAVQFLLFMLFMLFAFWYLLSSDSQLLSIADRVRGAGVGAKGEDAVRHLGY